MKLDTRLTNGLSANNGNGSKSFKFDYNGAEMNAWKDAGYVQTDHTDTIGWSNWQMGRQLTMATPVKGEELRDADCPVRNGAC